MIEKNLGNIERVCRLALASLFALWLTGQPSMGLVEWFVATVAMMLMLNGIFSRCYFWFVLDLDTRPKTQKATCV
ncbi:MAG: DUF2892 domain-containing protein [Pseudomonadales bacterium]